MDKSFHSLICSSVSLLDRSLVGKALYFLYSRSIDDLDKKLSFGVLIAVVVSKSRYISLLLKLINELLCNSLRIVKSAKQIQSPVNIVTISVPERLSYAFSHIVIKFRQ